MALASKSLFLYGYTVTEFNQSLDFKADIGDTSPRLATLRLGYYSLTSLLDEIVRALSEQDNVNTYTATAIRTANGGLENRVTISSSNSFFQILFATGPRSVSSCASLIGFPPTDHTGSTSYTGIYTTGTALIPSLVAYNYLAPEDMQTVFGSVNLSASGIKEAIVFNLQSFWQCEFKYEPKNKKSTEWVPFMQWAIQQRRLEFTPEITSPTVYYEGTLETTSADGKALSYKFEEMLPEFPNYFKTGMLKFRRSND